MGKATIGAPAAEGRRKLRLTTLSFLREELEAIYDSKGQAVGWRQRSTIFDNTGKPRAFTTRRAVFDFEGRHLGFYEDRWFRDSKGHVVAFESGATGGPLPPTRRPAGAPPLPDPDPPPPAVDVPSLPRMRSAAWSALGWSEYLDGERASTARS